MKNLHLLLLILTVSLPDAHAQKKVKTVSSWPVPDVPNLLFYIQRDPDINTVVYSVNHDKSGQLNEKDPIKIFWIKYADGGIHKPLNILQKDLAYGLSVKPSGSGTYEVKAVAYPKMPMRLQKGHDNKYQIRVNLGNKECVLKRIFIRITGGSQLHPDVAYLDFYGTELYTGKAVTERVIPN